MKHPYSPFGEIIEDLLQFEHYQDHEILDDQNNGGFYHSDGCTCKQCHMSSYNNYDFDAGEIW